MTKTQFSQALFNGGMSEHDSIAREDQYAYWENIDVFSDPNKIQLSTWTSSTTTINDKPFNMVEISHRWLAEKIVIFSNDNIYHYGNGTAVYTDGTMGDMKYPAYVLGDYIYWVNSTGTSSAFKLNRTTLTDAVSTTWTPTTWYLTLSNNDSFNYSSFVTIGLDAYVSLGNIIEYIAYNGWTHVTTPYENLFSEEIVGMATSYAGGIVVFTKDGKWHLWDGFSENVTSTNNLNIKPTKIYQYGSDIYILGWGWGSDKGLYFFNGQKAEPIYMQNYSGVAAKYKFYFESGIQTITNNKDNLYFVDKDDDGEERVAFFGSWQSGGQRGIHYINTTNASDQTMTDISSILYAQGNLYIWWDRTGASWVDVLWWSNPSGYIITNTKQYNTGKDALYTKSTEGIFFKVEDVDEDHTITVKVAVDWFTFTTIHTVNSTPKKWIVRITDNQFKDAGVSLEFDDITLRFDFATDNNTSPKIVRGIVHDVDINQEV